MRKALCAASLLLGAVAADAGTALAQAAAQAPASATAVPTVTFLPPLTVTKTADLNFGAWIAAANRVYSIGPDAAATTTGSTATFVGPAKSAASFRAVGSANAAVTWTIPASVPVMSGAGSLTITLVPSIAAGNNALTGQLDATGASTIFVGGTFTSPAAPPPAGTYTNAAGFTVTVTYQ